jgi:hypothetical protein
MVGTYRRRKHTPLRVECETTEGKKEQQQISAKAAAVWLPLRLFIRNSCIEMPLAFAASGTMTAAMSSSVHDYEGTLNGPPPAPSGLSVHHIMLPADARTRI